MIETWRWFGPKDPITLEHVAQTGACGIVTALHEIPIGTVWSPDDIAARKAEIETAGLTWEICESIPTPDAIKLRGAKARAEISVWKDTLANLGRAGIKTVCYNFMPVLDWTRTDLAYKIPNGGHALRFDGLDLAAFDAFVLKRKGVMDGMSDDWAAKVETRAAQFTRADIERLEHAILAGLPGGAQRLSKEAFLNIIGQFKGHTEQDMRGHLREFLAEICPVAEEVGVRLAIHPDDPPFSIFGLPRIVSTKADAEAVIAMNDSPSNGLTFCTGSYGARADNDLSDFVRAAKDRVHFAHLRNVQIEDCHAFHEANHLDGSADMVDIISELLSLDNLEIPLPFRPDHGHVLASDIGGNGNPGYTYIGRLKGLAELRGIITAIRHNELAV